MALHLPRLIDAFATTRLLVIGEAILDIYLEGASQRLCREAPVPVVEVTARREVPGGAANTAANVRSLGAQVQLLAVVGDDREGAALRRCLQRMGVGTAGLVVEPLRNTITKQRLIDDGQMLARFDQGDGTPLADTTEKKLIAVLEDAFAHSDAIILSDYHYGTFTPRIIETIARLQRGNPKILVVDSGNLSAFAAMQVTAVKPSYQQALALLGLPLSADAPRADVIAANADRLLTLIDSQIAAVSMDIDGVMLIERGRPIYRTYARPARASRSVGGGDTFVAALTLALSVGAGAPAAAELASAAASVVVGKDGTATCTAMELRTVIAGQEKRVLDVGALRDRLDYYRGQGKRLVFTNGCFDLIHGGHVGFLNRAKALGDVLIVAINSDASVRRLKGDGRPINTLEERIKVLSALSPINHIVPFESDTPDELLRTVRPDIFAKGGDYSRDTIPEAPLVESLGGAVCILPLIEERSTAGLIARIRRQAS